MSVIKRCLFVLSLNLTPFTVATRRSSVKVRAANLYGEFFLQQLPQMDKFTLQKRLIFASGFYVRRFRKRLFQKSPPLDLVFQLPWTNSMNSRFAPGRSSDFRRFAQISRNPSFKRAMVRCLFRGRRAK